MAGSGGCNGEGVCIKGSANCNATTCQCNSGYTWDGQICKKQGCAANECQYSNGQCLTAPEGGQYNGKCYYYARQLNLCP
jgi:hypothetical protein